MTRISDAFAAHRGRTGLIPFLTAGYPTRDATVDHLRRLERCGVLAVEIGIPFSDPIADGAEIQRASEWAVRGGMSALGALDLVREFRQGGGRTPIVVMTYANPVVAAGAERFAAAAAAAGVDGVLISDLPAVELPEVWSALDGAGLDTILLVAPNTAERRMPEILARCRGFVYCLARTGVTGRASGEAGDLEQRLAAVRARTSLPVAVGFGISSGRDAAALRGRVDAVVVGAAFMRAVAEDPERDSGDRVEALAREIVAALD